MFDQDWGIQTPQEFMFVYEEPNNGWWWLCKDPDALTWYHLNDTRYDKAIMYYLNHEDENIHEVFGPKQFTMDPEEVRAAKFTYAILTFARRIPGHCTFIDACRAFRIELADSQLKMIQQHGGIMMNRYGGYHSPVPYTQWVRRKSFLYPDYKESDIRVSQYPGGTHWYVHVGDMELHQGVDIKWDTKAEAEAVAKKYVEEA